MEPFSLPYPQMGGARAMVFVRARMRVLENAGHSAWSDTEVFPHQGITKAPYVPHRHVLEAFVKVLGVLCILERFVVGGQWMELGGAVERSEQAGMECMERRAGRTKGSGARPSTVIRALAVTLIDFLPLHKPVFSHILFFPFRLIYCGRMFIKPASAITQAH